MIYRVTVKTTDSDQPAGRETYWQRNVVYCGTSLEDARVEYLKNKPGDYWRGYGNAARETVVKQFESEPEEIDDETAAEVEMAEGGD